MRDLLDYYTPDSEHCGVSFLDGTESEHPDVVVADDLFAVMMLGPRISPAAARRLLDDTLESAQVTTCLDDLPIDLTIDEADADTLDAMLDLHEAVLAAVDPHAWPVESSHTVAAAVCARKRPELFPVLESRFCQALELPGPGDPRQSWQMIGDILTENLRDWIAELYGAARAAAPRLRLDIYPLRRLQVLASLRRPPVCG